MKKQSGKIKADGKRKEGAKGKKRGRGKKYILILSAGIIVPVLCLFVIYLAGVSYYRNRFLNGTVIDHVDVSGMTIPELEEQIQNYALRVIERQADGTTLEEEIRGSEIGISYGSTEPLQVILQAQNTYLWFLKQDASYETEAFPFYDEAALLERIGALRGFQKEFIKESADAYIADYVEGSGFELVAESQGNRLNRDKTVEVLKAAVDGMEEQVDFDQAGCYEEPEITLEDAKLQETYAKLQNYVNVVITYTFGMEKEVLDGDTIVSWIGVDGDKVTFDRTLAEGYVASLRKKYDTIFRPRKFLTSYGEEVTIDLGDYGWWMNTEQETEELIGMLERGESGERVPVYRQKAASYETPDYGDSYVEINLTAQHLFLYQNGVCVLESDFVSGNPSKGNGTPTGIYGITYKERNATLKGENYRTPVSYWMPFNNNVGMHDATWRSEFGGNIYQTNGSHGCINLPYSIAEQIYHCVEKDTPVICYQLPGTEQAPPAEETVEPQGAEPGAEMETPDSTMADPAAEAGETE
ncbi:L,D-transpeptidase family protein [Parablautia muri]|uniref:L,D-TPase catalytic domain-containing protein n=1 Tax=Parablautia muri TaxID=2320879 RepID=A0A9X5BD28_9FIRM|nr:L,D-transpeptidase family protein [Parablautia muri]NBJ91774.1 hypothetical protein [Parablautia muri]